MRNSRLIRNVDCCAKWLILWGKEQKEKKGQIYSSHDGGRGEFYGCSWDIT